MGLPPGLPVCGKPAAVRRLPLRRWRG